MQKRGIFKWLIVTAAHYGAHQMPGVIIKTEVGENQFPQFSKTYVQIC